VQEQGHLLVLSSTRHSDGSEFLLWEAASVLGSAEGIEASLLDHVPSDGLLVKETFGRSSRIEGRVECVEEDAFSLDPRISDELFVGATERGGIDAKSDLNLASLSGGSVSWVQTQELVPGILRIDRSQRSFGRLTCCAKGGHDGRHLICVKHPLLFRV
jgi:hypothetical protein